ncbi:MAG: NADH-quinone oxidoreductase subunit C [Gammaproteobacteria bacterium]|nr:MAG: NADH-quinone oxidoreductase subunit C [Gammaproteobacteria bacterium]
MPEIKVKPKGPRRVRVDLPASSLPALLELLKGRAGYLHLSAISCVDWPDTEEYELVYHVWSYETKVLISVHIRIPYEPGRFISVYDLYTPAAFFERDIHEMFGVYFEGSPDMSPFILTEWNGPPPMKKSFSSIGYVEETYQWREYHPEWLKDIEEKGGGLEA